MAEWSAVLLTVAWSVHACVRGAEIAWGLPKTAWRSWFMTHGVLRPCLGPCDLAQAERTVPRAAFAHKAL